MRYSWAYAYSPDFVPITSADQIPAAEAAGKLEIINPGAPDPYQLSTTRCSSVPSCPGAETHAHGIAETRGSTMKRITTLVASHRRWPGRPSAADARRSRRSGDDVPR